ncbi:hypothetical protein MRX96_021866 [Rhipicephalus microplus]
MRNQSRALTWIYFESSANYMRLAVCDAASPEFNAETILADGGLALWSQITDDVTSLPMMSLPTMTSVGSRYLLPRAVPDGKRLKDLSSSSQLSKNISPLGACHSGGATNTVTSLPHRVPLMTSLRCLIVRQKKTHRRRRRNVVSQSMSEMACQNFWTLSAFRSG